MRRAAKKDLAPIVAKLNILKSGISAEKYEELNGKYVVLERAVGNIQGNKVNH